MNDDKKQMTQKPTRDDVHEQREPDQTREGVVEKPHDPKADKAPPREGGKQHPTKR